MRSNGLAGMHQVDGHPGHGKLWTDAFVCEGYPGRQGGYVFSTTSPGRIIVDVAAVLPSVSKDLGEQAFVLQQSMPRDRVSPARDS